MVGNFVIVAAAAAICQQNNCNIYSNDLISAKVLHFVAITINTVGTKIETKKTNETKRKKVIKSRKQHIKLGRIGKYLD